MVGRGRSGVLQKRRHRPEEVQEDAEGHLLDFHQGFPFSSHGHLRRVLLNPSGGFWHHKCQTSHGTRCYGHCVEK